jgi:hypothetical protein
MYRPFTKATAAPPTPLGDLILAAISAACEEEKAKQAFRFGQADRRAIDVTARKALEAQDAAFRRLREIAAEEIGGEGA